MYLHCSVCSHVHRVKRVTINFLGFSIVNCVPTVKTDVETVRYQV